MPLTTEMTYETGTVDTGVVVSIDGNEFVWVPVPDVIWDGTTTITSGSYTPMAVLQSDNTNYQGVLYTFNGTTATYQSTYTLGKNNYREPDEVSADTGYCASEGIGKTLLQGEYNSMVESVDKYKGFYVARYELGLEGTSKTPVSKKASETVTTANATESSANKWYGLYKKCKEMYNKSTQNVTSTMIWGSQYDAMMNWMAKTEKAVGSSNSTAWGSDHKTTGTQLTDILNNVYDLYGCHYECTIEAINRYFRIVRRRHVPR